jgi:hypothetical protein
MELITKKKEIIDSLAGVLDDDDKPYFSMKFLIEHMMGLNQDDIRVNNEIMEARAKKAKKEEKGGEEGEETVTL